MNLKIPLKNTGWREIVLHIVFWSAWVISFTIIQSLGKDSHEYFVWFMYYLITLPVFISHTYLIAYWLVPSVFFKNRYVLFTAGFLSLLVIFSVIELIVSNELVFKLFDVEKSFGPGYLNFKNIVISGIGNHYIILVFLAIKAGNSWYSANTRKDELARLNLETELEIYRYQLQPKIILTLMEELEHMSKSDAENVPETIIKISNFINRFLYEGREELIPLQFEAALMEEFLEIHKQALGARFTSNFVVSGNLKTHLVPPLLLIPFINNAIKIAYKCNDSYESTVIIKEEKKYILFTFTFWSEKEFRIDDNENLEITKKRLNYNYAGKYRLIESMDDNFREVSLEIFS